MIPKLHIGTDMIDPDSKTNYDLFYFEYGGIFQTINFIFFFKRLCRAHNILSRAHDLLCHRHDILCRAHEIPCRAHEMLSCERNILSCGQNTPPPAKKKLRV